MIIEFLLLNSSSSCLVRCFKIKEASLLVMKRCLLYIIHVCSPKWSLCPPSHTSWYFNVYYSNWLFNISVRSIIRKRNKKSCRKHKNAKEQNAWTTAKCFQLLWWWLTVSRQCPKSFHGPATHRQIQRGKSNRYRDTSNI